MLKATALIATVMFSSAAWAAASSGVAVANSITNIGLVFAYLLRRRQIGGWLFFYYFYLVVGTLLTCLTLPAVSDGLHPSSWESTSLYVWYLLATVPQMTALIAEFVLAGWLLCRRNASSLGRFRLAQAALVVVSTLTFVVELAYFDTASVIGGGHTLIAACIWTWYFRRSERVRKVFVEGRWTLADAPPTTDAERRYLWKRAAVAAAAAYVALLLMLAAGREGLSQPDVFAVPLGIAAVAGMMGRILPIGAKKKLALNPALALRSHTAER